MYALLSHVMGAHVAFYSERGRVLGLVSEENATLINGGWI